jgi:iron complex transport system substrate-binding protein
MKKISMSTVLVLFSLVLFHPVILGFQKLTIEDDLGDTHILSTPPQRIVSLAPNVTEILFALGLEDKIVGVTRFCNYPNEARTKYRIGGMVDPDLEKIIALHPDLVIAFRGNPLRVVQRLKSLDLPIFVLESGTTLKSVLALIQRIGLATGRKQDATNLVNHLNQGFEKTKERLRTARTRPKVFINLHGKGLWTCGKNSFMNDLVQEAGGENIAGEVPRAWFSHNREELIHKNPDHIIVLAKEEEDFQDVKTWLAEEAHLGSIQAVQQGNITFLDEDFVTRPGPRIFDAFHQLARILHPACFEENR